MSYSKIGTGIADITLIIAISLVVLAYIGWYAFFGDRLALDWSEGGNSGDNTTIG